MGIIGIVFLSIMFVQLAFSQEQRPEQQYKVDSLGMGLDILLIGTLPMIQTKANNCQSNCLIAFKKVDANVILSFSTKNCN